MIEILFFLKSFVDTENKLSRLSFAFRFFIILSITFLIKKTIVYYYKNEVISVLFSGMFYFTFFYLLSYQRIKDIGYSTKITPIIVLLSNLPLFQYIIFIYLFVHPGKEDF